MRKIFSLIAFCAIALFAIAQGGAKLSGSIQDGNGKAASAVTVSLLRSSDSTLVKMALTDGSGRYEFLNIPSGKYRISISSVGFIPSVSKDIEVSSGDVQIPLTALQPVSKDMSEVTVTAKKPFVETKLDRTIVNVDASPGSAGSTALEILEKSPGVMVNSDGVISLRGKQGVIVMVDGKPTYLSATDLANLLKNMPASALDQIEIMTNPSSKYDASGNSGIINIKTKKGKNNGFNGSIMVGATTSIYKLDDKIYFMPKSQNSFNFNYRKNKVNFFGNYNPNASKGRNTMDIHSRLIDAQDGQLKGYNDQQTRFQFRNFNHTLKLGLDYNLGRKDVIGIVASGFSFNGHPTPVTEATLKDVDGNFQSRLITHTNNDISFKNFTGNLNWKHSFDSTGKELTADFDIVRYKTLSEMFMNTNTYSAGFPYTSHAELKGHLPSDIQILSFRSDYVKPIKDGRIEAGVKTSFVKNENIVDYQFRSGNDWIQDQIRSNHYIYEENVNAAYINANRQFKKWTLQAGLRVENMKAEGNQLTSKTTFKRDTTNLFPTAFISYAASKTHTFTASYGKRINRPNYQDLNPFIFFLDTLSYRQGNPYLRPQYTHNFELSHAFMGRFITTLAYNNTDDVISQIIRPKAGSEGKIRFLTPDNVAKLRNMSLSVTAPLKPAKWWNMNLFVNVFNNHYTGVYDNIDIDMAFTSFMVNMTNSLTISKGFSAELSGFYRHKAVDQLTRIEPLYQMSIAFQKQVIQGKGTVRLNIRDPFAWQRFSGLNDYGYVYMTFKNRPDVRQITATFTYRFGKSNQQQPPRRRAGSSQEEQNRVGGAGQG
jgi:outer membrane receptor protein involved in Fe transport